MDDVPLVSPSNIQVLGAKTRNRDFLLWLGEMLSMDWLKEHKVKEDITAKVTVSLACSCVENNDFVSLQEILNRVDTDTDDYDGSSPIHRACEKGNIDMIMYLLSRGASYNLADRKGNTPMSLAIRNRHLGIVKMLQTLGGTIYMESVRIGMELCKAVQDRDYVMLKAWHLAGVNMDQGDYNGRTALHTAVRNRDSSMVSKLLEYGATPLEVDVWGWTAVDEAKKRNFTEILLQFHPLFTEKFTDKHVYQLYKIALDDGLE